jgi:DNA-binding MarR family transcriptional regulator
MEKFLGRLCGMDKTLGRATPVGTNSLDQMAEEIFALTVMSWRERIAARSQNADELSEPQYLAIETLAHAAESGSNTLTVGEIQRSIGVLPAQMSRIMRSLESGFAKPLVRCELNQSDKRKIDVKLTAEGRRYYEDFRHARLSKTVDILQQLSERDRSEFVRICSRIRQLFASSMIPPAVATTENTTA